MTMNDEKLKQIILLNRFQHKAACALQLAIAVMGFIGWLWHGSAVAILAIAGVLFFQLAKPGPDPEIDAELARREREARAKR